MQRKILFKKKKRIQIKNTICASEKSWDTIDLNQYFPFYDIILTTKN